MQPRHHRAVSGTAVREQELRLEALHAVDEGEDQQQARLAEEQRQIDEAEAGQPLRPVDAGGVEHVRGDVLQSGVVDEERETAHPGEADADQGVERDPGIAQPCLLPGRQPQGAERVVEGPEVVVEEEPPDQEHDDAGHHHRDDEEESDSHVPV